MYQLYRYGENPALHAGRRLESKFAGGVRKEESAADRLAHRGVYRAEGPSITRIDPQNRRGGGGFVKGENPLDKLFKDPETN